MIEITGHRGKYDTPIAVFLMPRIGVYTSYRDTHSAGEIANAPVYCARIACTFAAITGLVSEIETTVRGFGE